MQTTFAYYAAFIGLGLVSASLGPTLPGLAQQTGTDLGAISFLFTTRATGYMLGSLLGGRLYDRASGNPVMAGGLAVMVAGMLLVPTVPLLLLLASILLAIGVAEGAVDVGGNTLLVWVHRAKVGPYMNALHFMFGLGAFLSPLFIALAIRMTGGVSWGYWLLGLCVLPVPIWLARLRSPIPEALQDGVSAAPANWRLVALIGLFMVLYVSAEVGYGGWIYTYGVTTGLADATTAAYLNSLYWGALTVGRLAAIWIALRWRPRTILLADLLGCIASVALILLFQESAWALWAGTFGLGLAMASIFPTVITWAERRMTVSGAVTSVFLVGASLGAMFLPWLIGQYFESRGPQVMMVAVMAALLAASAVFGLLMASGGTPKVEKASAV
jgi:FHS family Na+ dependent glucose MFS transporter 1